MNVIKFMYYLSLRTGCLIFAYFAILCSSITIIYQATYGAFLYTCVSDESKTMAQSTWYALEETELSPAETKGDVNSVLVILALYILSYIIVFGLLFIFSVLLAVGIHKNNRRLVNLFFVYAFVHIVLTSHLIGLECFVNERPVIPIMLFVIGDIVVILALFVIKRFMENIKSGKVYSAAGIVYHKTEVKDDSNALY